MPAERVAEMEREAAQEAGRAAAEDRAVAEERAPEETVLVLEITLNPQQARRTPAARWVMQVENSETVRITPRLPRERAGSRETPFQAKRR